MYYFPTSCQYNAVLPSQLLEQGALANFSGVLFLSVKLQLGSKNKFQNRGYYIATVGVRRKLLNIIFKRHFVKLSSIMYLFQYSSYIFSYSSIKAYAL